MKKILISAFSLYLVFVGSFFLFESDDLFAAVDEDQLQVILTVGSDITISAPADCTLKPDLANIADGTADCYAEWTITTGAFSGFTAALTATTTSSAPDAWILTGNTYGDGFENYNWDSQQYATNTAEYTWSLTANTAEFGYKASTTDYNDLATIFRDNGSSTCGGAGTSMTNDKCFMAASSTSRTVMTKTASAPSGIKLYIHFRAGKSSHVILQDTYTATTTVTATTSS